MTLKSLKTCNIELINQHILTFERLSHYLRNLNLGHSSSSYILFNFNLISVNENIASVLINNNSALTVTHHREFYTEVSNLVFILIFPEENIRLTLTDPNQIGVYCRYCTVCKITLGKSL